jgi:hypothetical protein
MRFLSLLAIVTGILGCAAPPQRTAARPGPFTPLPVRVDAPAEIAALVERLGDQQFERRAAAQSDLEKLGTRPETQGVVVEALRAASTSPDPEIRSRARTTLSTIDRTEGMIPSGSMSLTLNSEKVELALRHFADGSVELVVRMNDGDEELFSGKDMADLATKVTKAARQRGYGEEVFTMTPEGAFEIAGNTTTIGLAATQHLVRDFQAWVSRVAETDRTLPERVRGCWRIDARMLGGRAYKAGLRVGDFVAEIDGKKPATFDDFHRGLASGKSIKVLRLTLEEVDLRP